jgi:hypothetical protein
MQRSDCFAVLVAAFVLGAGAYLSTYPLEIIRIVGLVLMAGSIVGLLVWFMLGRGWTGHATWGPDGRIEHGRLRAALGGVLLCLVLGGGYVWSHWPTAFLRTQTPSSGNASSAPSGPFVSRLNHFILSCDVPPPPPNKTPLDSLWELQDYKQKLDVLGDAMGITFTMETIRGGIRIEAEAATDEAKQRIPSLTSIGVTKFIFEIRRVEKVLLVSVIVKLPPQFAFYGWIPPNPAAEDTKKVIYFVEHFFGFKTGACSLV